MSHAIQAYANHCGVEPSDPHLVDLFYPICFDKYLVFHTSSQASDISHYDHWGIVLQTLKPFFDSEGIKIVQIQTGAQINTKFDFCDLFLSGLSFQQISYVISKSQGYVGIDNVLMHIASMHDKKIVGLFPDSYPETNKPVWNKSAPVICLSPDFSECKPFFGRSSNRKRINEIMPESIVSSVIKIIKGYCPQEPMTSIHIGSNYHSPIVEIIPDFFNPKLIQPNQSANIRADLHLDQTVILNWAATRPVNIFINGDQIKDILFISQVKKNIHQMNIFVDLNTSNEDLKQLKKLGIKVFLLCKDKENLDKVRLKLIDWSIDLFEQKTKKDIDKNSDIDYTSSRFNSTKTVLSKNLKYPSLYHAVKDEQTIDVLFDEELFWSDIDNFYIYNRNHAKRTPKENYRREKTRS